MKRRSILALVVLYALTHSAAGLAHHSFAAVFDGSRTMDVEGVVKEFRLVNPHAMMTLEVTDQDGQTALKMVEFDGRLNLTVGGWTEDTIRVGEHVVVHGNPARSDGDRLWFLKLTHEDGTELVRPVLARFNAIDEQRRQRRERQREEQN